MKYLKIDAIGPLALAAIIYLQSAKAEDVYNDHGQIIGHTRAPSYYWGPAPNGQPLYVNNINGGMLSSGIPGPWSTGYLWNGEVDQTGNGYIFRYIINQGKVTTYTWRIVNGRYSGPKIETQ
jgi:hypothetical protein